jgi:hypothetical protein
MTIRHHATNSGPFRSATAGRRSAALAAGLCAILLALGGCSSDVWSKFSFGGGNSDADKAAANADDTKCQSAGNQYGTPEYSQCLQNLASKRATTRDIPLGPTSAPTR